MLTTSTLPRLLVEFGQCLHEMTAEGRSILSAEERSLMERLIEAGLAGRAPQNPGVWPNDHTPCWVYPVYGVGVLVEGGRDGQTEWLPVEDDEETETE